MEWALYDEAVGFYAGAGRARRDFVTSPEVGMLFGAVVARAVDGWWDGLRRPDPFVVVEAGAGPGTLARTVLAAAPACAPALRWVLVERSAAQRASHADHLPLVPAEMAFGPEDHDSARPQPAGRGPLVVSLADLPRPSGPCVVLANELLDNLRFDVWERRSGGWWEVRVSAELEEVVLPNEPPPWLAGVDGPEGARVPVQVGAASWLRDALAVARLPEGGRVVAFDYCVPTTAEVAARGGWLRTYRGNERGGPPLEAPGTQDITADVCIDQLGRRPSSVGSQAEWLRAHGIDDLVADAAGVTGADLAALKLRSRLAEAPRLLDPDGLGAFTVLEWRAAPRSRVRGGS
jgi:SAM-dependent MidA family methyltransferase